MDRRKERRLNLELPVRIWGVDRMSRPFAEIVRARNVSTRGAVLIGVRSKIQTGEAAGRAARGVPSAVSNHVDQSFGRGRHTGSRK